MSSTPTYTLYLDETGDPHLEKINPEFPIFGLGGVLIEDTALGVLEADLSAVKQDIFGDPKIVLHSVDIRKKRKEFKCLFDELRAQNFYNRFNNFVENGEFEFISIFIDKPAHVKKYKTPYDPYEWGMELLLERFAYFLRPLNARGRVVVESRGAREDRQLKAAFIRALYRGTSHVSAKTLTETIENEIKFEPKKANGLGLQLADMLLYPVARAIINDNPTNPAFHIVAGKMHRTYGCRCFPNQAPWVGMAQSNYPTFARQYPVRMPIKAKTRN